MTTPVPDDRIHGDSLPGAEPYGDTWLRPTLTREATGPAEPVPGAPDRPGGPTSSRRWWLVAGLGATLVLASLAGAGTWGSLTGGLWRSAEQRTSYAQPAGPLRIEADASDVVVRGGGTPGTVDVLRHLSWGPGSGQPRPRQAWSGSTLEVGAECQGLLGWCSVDYVVTVADGSDVTVAAGSGDITVTGSLGAVAVKTGSGDIETTELSAGRLTAEAGSGDVDVELASAASPIGITTGSGDVSVQLPPGATYAVDVQAGSGDTQVDVPADPRSTSTLRVRTGSGDIAVDSR